MDAFFDDSEVEIVDLDQGDSSDNPRRRNSTRFTRRQRGFGTFLTGMVFVLTIGFLLASISGVNGLVWHNLFKAPSFSPPKKALFYVAGNPSWGQFVINGKLLTHNPVIGQDQPLALPFGTYTVSWQAAPFRSQSCTLDVPELSARTRSACELSNIFLAELHTQVHVISFFASLADLPPSQRDSVIQQVQTTLDEGTDSATVQPGEFYALSGQQAQAYPASCQNTPLSSLCYARAKQPLLATLHLQPDLATVSADQCNVEIECLQNAQDCQIFCENPAVPLGARGWNVNALTRSYWTYTTLRAQMKTRDQPASFIRDIPAYQLLSLHLTLDQQGWQAMLFNAPGMADTPDGNPVCIQAKTDMKDLLNPFLPDNLGSAQVVADATSSPADGCLIAFRPVPKMPGNSASFITTFHSNLGTAYCLERFGVLLAVNDVAHRFWPYLPVANVQEQRLAMLLAYATFSSRADLAPVSSVR